MQTSLRFFFKKILNSLPINLQIFLRKFKHLLTPYKAITEIPQEELKIFEVLKDDLSVIFDIGAREDLSFFNIKSNCEYHLFEPNRKFVSNLKEKISLLDSHNIYLNDFGLSDEENLSSIYYEDSQSFEINPFFQTKDKGTRYKLKKLDDYVYKNDIKNINFLKIDAEGLDYKVIKGGINTIKTKVDFIQFESWGGVKNFSNLLDDIFILYLLMEPRLNSVITKDIYHLMTEEQKKIDFNVSLIKLNIELVKFIDEILWPRGYAVNILGIKKSLNSKYYKKLNFKVIKIV